MAGSRHLGLILASNLLKNWFMKTMFMPFFLSNSLLDQEHGGSALSLYDLGWTEVDQEEA